MANPMSAPGRADAPAALLARHNASSANEVPSAMVERINLDLMWYDGNDGDLPIPRQSLALVVTTIARPTQQLLAHSAMAQKQGSTIVVAGDEKGPDVFEMPNTTFLSLEMQREFSSLGRALDTGTYARKNVAYLRAIADGADIIVETDDDNAPMDSFSRRRSPNLTARIVDRPGWFNVYSVFSDTGVWPRGFPLEWVKGRRAFRTPSCPRAGLKLRYSKALQMEIRTWMRYIG